MSSRRAVVSVLTVLVAVMFSSFAFAQTAGGTPRLTLVEPLKDFGTVAKGEKLDWNFVVRNTGDADLHILAVRPACGCTVAEYDKVIKPGESGKISAHVDTSTFSGPSSRGITVETNDPNTPTAQLTIHAIVKPYVEAFPAGFLRYNMIQGDTEVKSVTMYTEETEPFEIVRAEVPGDYVKVDVTKIENEAERVKQGRTGQAQYRLDVTVGGPTAKIGPLADRITIVTSSANQPEYTLNLSGVIRPSYKVVPTVLNFGEVSTGGSTVQNILISSNSMRAPGEFKVTKVESGSPNVTAEAKPTEVPGEYEITVKLADNAKAGALDSNLRIFTTDAVNPVYTLPVKGTIKGAGASK